LSYSIYVLNCYRLTDDHATSILWSINGSKQNSWLHLIRWVLKLKRTESNLCNEASKARPGFDLNETFLENTRKGIGKLSLTMPQDW